MTPKIGFKWTYSRLRIHKWLILLFFFYRKLLKLTMHKFIPTSVWKVSASSQEMTSTYSSGRLHSRSRHRYRSRLRRHKTIVLENLGTAKASNFAHRFALPHQLVGFLVLHSGERHELLLSVVRRRKSSWFGNVCRHDTLPKIIRGTVDGSHRRRRPRKSRRDNIHKWSG